MVRHSIKEHQLNMNDHHHTTIQDLGKKVLNLTYIKKIISFFLSTVTNTRYVFEKATLRLTKQTEKTFLIHTSLTKTILIKHCFVCYLLPINIVWEHLFFIYFFLIVVPVIIIFFLFIEKKYSSY